MLIDHRQHGLDDLLLQLLVADEAEQVIEPLEIEIGMMPGSLPGQVLQVMAEEGGHEARHRRQKSATIFSSSGTRLCFSR